MAFHEKVYEKVNSPFQKDHIYILRGEIPVKKNILAEPEGFLDGREGGMVLRLLSIEKNGIHIFHEMLYAREESLIKLEGYNCEYAVNFEDINIQDFEDITDDADYTEFLHSMEENNKKVKPYLKKTYFRSDLTEKLIGTTALILSFAVFLFIAAVITYIVKRSGAPIYSLATIFIGLVPLSISIILMSKVAVSLNNDFPLPEPLDSICSAIEKKLNKKGNAILESIYHKSDILLQSFEEKKHLER